MSIHEIMKSGRFMSNTDLCRQERRVLYSGPCWLYLGRLADDAKANPEEHNLKSLSLWRYCKWGVGTSLLYHWYINCSR